MIKMLKDGNIMLEIVKKSLTAGREQTKKKLKTMLRKNRVKKCHKKTTGEN